MNSKFINKEGQTIPSLTLRTRDQYEWKDVSTDTLFKERNVVVFSLPGAFTPTCSSTHVPRFNDLAESFKKEGIDEIVCVSVNDPFVMQAWAVAEGASNLTLLPDGNGAFTQAMGMLVNKEDLNFGQRSWRYSMLVRNGVIEKMFIEPDEQGDPFKVSDADTMLSYINPLAVVPPQVVLFSKEGCSYCSKAKMALDTAKVAFVEMSLPNATRGCVIGALTGGSTVPQMFVDGLLVGGSDNIEDWIKNHG